MREIKFRGKDKKGNWAYGNLFSSKQYQGETYIIQENDLSDDNFSKGYNFPKDMMYSVQVDLKTVGQFTGLHDKDGNEIYEGDILKDWEGLISIVVWNYNGYSLETVNEKSFKYRGNLHESSHVIGNIYENQELISDR